MNSHLFCKLWQRKLGHLSSISKSIVWKDLSVILFWPRRDPQDLNSSVLKPVLALNTSQEYIALIDGPGGWQTPWTRTRRCGLCWSSQLWASGTRGTCGKQKASGNGHGRGDWWLQDLDLFKTWRTTVGNCWDRLAKG